MVAVPSCVLHIQGPCPYRRIPFDRPGNKMAGAVAGVSAADHCLAPLQDGQALEVR
jgi:hypothetical protein